MWSPSSSSQDATFMFVRCLERRQTFSFTRRSSWKEKSSHQFLRELLLKKFTNADSKNTNPCSKSGRRMKNRRWTRFTAMMLSFGNAPGSSRWNKNCWTCNQFWGRTSRFSKICLFLHAHEATISLTWAGTTLLPSALCVESQIKKGAPKLQLTVCSLRWTRTTATLEERWAKLWWDLSSLRL
jgi:hypothetical protein